MTPSSRVRAALDAAGLEAEEVSRLVATAFEEDLRYGPDVTTQATVRPDVRAEACVVAHGQGVVAGVPVALAAFEHAGLDIAGVSILCPDGQSVHPGDVVLAVEGGVSCLLSAERTVLNFLTHLSGVATATRAWVDALAGTGARVRDTRKTLPGLRSLQKYAVRCGGGVNHRLGLGDGALIKDNHVAAAGGVGEAIAALAAAGVSVDGAFPLEVECDTVEQVAEAVAAGARQILLDNMDPDELRAAVGVARSAPRRVVLEASGGLRLESARRVAETGVDYLSVGALTHSAPVLDLGLDLRTTTVAAIDTTERGQ